MAKKFLHKLVEISPKEFGCKLCNRRFHKNLDKPLESKEECPVRLRYYLDSLGVTEEKIEELEGKILDQDAQMLIMQSSLDEYQEKLQASYEETEKVRKSAHDATEVWTRRAQTESHWAKKLRDLWRSAEDNNAKMKKMLDDIIVRCQNDSGDLSTIKMMAETVLSEVADRSVDVEKVEKDFLSREV